MKILILIITTVLFLQCNEINTVSSKKNDLETISKIQIRTLNLSLKLSVPNIIEYNSFPEFSDYNNDIDYHHEFMFHMNKDTGLVEIQTIIRNKSDFDTNDSLTKKWMYYKIMEGDRYAEQIKYSEKMISNHKLFIANYNNGCILIIWVSDKPIYLNIRNFKDNKVKEAIINSIEFI